MKFVEQGMNILRAHGWALRDIDACRRAVAKGVVADIWKYRQLFLEGSVGSRFLTSETALQLWNEVEESLRYGVPFSHYIAKAESALATVAETRRLFEALVKVCHENQQLRDTIVSMATDLYLKDGNTNE